MKTFTFMILLVFFACSNQKQYKFDELHLGTSFSITISIDKNITYDDLKKIIYETFSLVEKQEKKIFSVYENKSELALINKSLSQKSLANKYFKFTVSPELFYVIEQALNISDKTSWAFDVSYKYIADLWKTSIPSKAKINIALKHTGKEAIKISKPNIIFIKNSASIGLGGIAKGYIVDSASNLLSNKSINNFLVNAGGDLAVSGSKNGKAWNISILNPSTGNSALGFCKFINTKKSIVTSGSYYRYTTINGKKFSHIIDPRTGMPCESNISSITVIADNTLIADAFATGLYVLGYSETEQNFEYLDKLGLGVIIVHSNGKIALNSKAKKSCEVNHTE